MLSGFTAEVTAAASEVSKKDVFSDYSVKCKEKVLQKFDYLQNQCNQQYFTDKIDKKRQSWGKGNDNQKVGEIDDFQIQRYLDGSTTNGEGMNVQN